MEKSNQCNHWLRFFQCTIVQQIIIYKNRYWYIMETVIQWHQSHQSFFVCLFVCLFVTKPGTCPEGCRNSVCVCVCVCVWVCTRAHTCMCICASTHISTLARFSCYACVMYQNAVKTAISSTLPNSPTNNEFIRTCNCAVLSLCSAITEWQCSILQHLPKLMNLLPKKTKA